MPIGSSQRDRRRRVLLDDTQEGSPSNNPNRSNSGFADEESASERPYTDEALVDNHLPTTWLVPKKFWVVACIAISLILATFFLNVLNANVPNWSEKYGASKVIAFDMAAGNGLVRWLTVFLLIVGASNCLNIYLIRRHRSDDYRGTYRVWAWLTAFILVVSMNASTNFDSFLYTLGEDLAREHLGIRNRSHFLLIALAPVAVVILRVSIELRSSISSVGSFGLAVGAFMIALLLRIESVVLPAHVDTKIIHCNLMLIGYIAMYLSTVSYSRFVFLDSQGKLSDKWSRKSQRREARQIRSDEMKTERARRKEQRKLERTLKAEQRADEQSKIAGQKRKPSAQSKQSSPQHDNKASSSMSSNRTSPLQSRVKQQQDKLATTDSSTGTQKKSRLIPDFQEIADDDSSEISIEELQMKMARCKSRSERKRLKKLIQQRRQGRAA